MNLRKTPRVRRSVALGAGLATVAAGIAAFGISTADATGTAPMDIVLGVGANQSERIVTWYAQDSSQQAIKFEEGTALDSSAKTLVADSAPNTVADTEAGYGQTRNKLDTTTGANAGPESLTAQSGYYHAHVALEDLKPNTKYTYEVGAADGSGWSTPYTFFTGTAGNSFTFAAFGDPQIGSSSYSFNDGRGWAKTLDYIAANAPQTELLVSTGDQVEAADNEWDWTNWADPHTDNVPGSTAISPVLKQFTYAPQIGNHEGAYSEGTTSATTYPSGRAYSQHFYPPNQNNDASFFRTSDTFNAVQGSTANRPGGDYWYTYKNVLFININSNAYTTGSNGVNSDAAHAAYIKDVVDHHSTGTKWQVVTFHHAIYSPADHANDADNSQRRKDLTYTLSQEGVDLVIQGHDHAYSRSYELKSSAAGTAPTKSNAAEQPGAQNVATGPGGVVYVTVDSSSGSKYYDLSVPDTSKNGGDYGPDTLAGNNDANQARHWANSVEAQPYTPTYTQVDVTDSKLTVTNVATQNWDADTNSAVKSKKAGQRIKTPATTSPSVDPTSGATTTVTIPAVPFNDGELAALGDQRPSASASIHHLQTQGAVTDKFDLSGGNTNAFPSSPATPTATVTVTAPASPGATVTITAAPTTGPNSAVCLNAKWNVKVLKAKHAKKKKIKAAQALAVLACK